MTRRALIVLGLAAAIAGCGRPDSTYFPQPFETTVSSPALVGEWVDYGAVDLAVTNDDSVKLEALELVDMKGSADVDAVVLSRASGGGIGIIREADLPSDLNVNDSPRLAESVLTKAVDPVQIVVRIRPSAPGRVFAARVRLTFQVGSAAPVSETFPAGVLVCAGSTLQADCR